MSKRHLLPHVHCGIVRSGRDAEPARVHPWVSGSRRCGVYTQCNMAQPTSVTLGDVSQKRQMPYDLPYTGTPNRTEQSPKLQERDQVGGDQTWRPDVAGQGGGEERGAHMV